MDTNLVIDEPEGDLFGAVPESSVQEPAGRRVVGPPRVQQPNRTQIELRPCDLESLLPEDHPSRLVWGYVERQDLGVLLDAIKARGSGPGRAAIDPRLLFALWLYATLDGVGSGRELERLTQAHDAYRWLCGGVSVNYHALNDFRSQQGELLDRLLTDNVAALASAGVISLKRVAQDGIRVRASAGAASFRRRERLSKQRTLAAELVRSLKAEAQEDPGAANRRAQAARERAAAQRERAIEAALAQLPEQEAAKRRNGQPADTARASTTDAEARVMKMADGGYRPAYNLQYASDCDGQVIVGVDVSTSGSDMAQLAPMVAQVEQRLGRAPEQWLVDGGFPAHDQIDAVAGKTEVIAPVPKPRPPKRKDDDAPKGGTGCQAASDAPSVAPVSEFDPKPGDSPAVIAWRQRMRDEATQSLYRLRAATAECVNAQARNRGLQRLPVRGQAKVKAVALLFALAHNLMRMAHLAPQFIRAA
jgi:transposase